MIAVTFNRDLTADEQADVIKTGNYSVKKSNVEQNVKAEFNDAKTLYITTSADVAFTAGTYTVALNGNVKYTADVTIETAVATSIKIASTVVENTTTAAIKVTVLDQYSDEITLDNKLSLTFINKTDATRTATYAITDGKIVVNASNYKVGDEVIVTAVYTSGTVALTDTATLKVVAEDYVNALVLGELVLPSTAIRLTADTKGVKIPYTATKLYGDSAQIELGADKDYSVISSNAAVVDAANVGVDYDTITKTAYITISEFGSDGTTTLVFVNNKTGETVSTTITVLKNAGEPTTAALAQDKVTVAAGSTTAVDITVKDNYGDVIEAEKLVGKVIITPSNNTVTASLQTDKTKDNYGKIVIDATNAKENTTVICTITVADTPLILTVSIAETAKPASISAVAGSNSLLVGGETDIKVNVVDQYSGTFTVSGSAYSVVATADASGVVTVDGLKVSAAKAGTGVVTVELKDSSNNTVLSQKVTFTVVANDAANFDYAVKDIPTLCPTQDYDKNYAQPVNVTATQKTNTSVVLDLPAGKIIDVKSDNNAVGVKAVDNVYYVYGNLANVSGAALTADVTANLTVTILTDTGYQTIQKAVTVSKDDAKAQSAALYDKAITEKDKKVITTVTVASGSALEAGEAINLATIDQYGVAKEVTDVEAKYVNITSPTDVTITGSAEIKDGKLYVTGVEAKNGGTFQVNVYVDGVTTAFTVKVTSAN